MPIDTSSVTERLIRQAYDEVLAEYGPRIQAALVERLAVVFLHHGIAPLVYEVHRDHITIRRKEPFTDAHP